MCIRDRLYKSCGLGLVDEELIDDVGFSLYSRCLSMLQVRDCLLYTSDAADERSSVDLGGRRIIKKKNK